MKTNVIFIILLGCIGWLSACSTKDDTPTFQQPGTNPAPTPVVEDTGKYVLVWADEFNEDENGLPNPDEWWFENGGGGWGNGELQYYLGNGYYDGDTVALIRDGMLKITAFKRDYENNQYISARMNTTKSWLYGRFEARLKVPGGKGGWPAFWMLAKDFKSWPLDGEIDIMEYVGWDANVIHGSIHTESYNHSIGTQKTATTTVSTAESEFHVYALEWSKTKIQVFVDDKAYFMFYNDGKNDKNTWPFNAPFYLKLNLAVGGWGGQDGIDDSIFPLEYDIDYVRVYQKQ